MKRNSLYQHVILEHNKYPRNFGEMENHTHSAQGKNPLCGDEISLQLKKFDNIIEAVAFQGSGCALATASASLMTERIKTLAVEEAEELVMIFNKLVDGIVPDTEEVLGDLRVFAELKNFPARKKCALLPWTTLRAALENEKQTITTE